MIVYVLLDDYPFAIVDIYKNKKKAIKRMNELKLENSYLWQYLEVVRYKVKL